ncbi:MAG: AbrB/MazE/SpoVT family DNA-binding domain-containing protein [Clostridia bacterium]|nr:AbrB/MazE/SpoVT family DNA-binding domain-containing protein [Clostridia bacterium]
MKKIYSIRKIDNLGRIVIPMDFRKALEIQEWDELAISLRENEVVIRKAQNACTFCGSEEGLTEYEGRFLCKACLEKLKSF